jgi:hypothetical protein
LHAPGASVPPSSLAPVAESSRPRAARRPLLAVMAAALLALPLAWLAFAGLRSHLQREPAASAVTAPAPIASDVAPASPPVSIASTVKPIAPLATESSPASSTLARPPKPSSEPPRKAVPAASASTKPQRPSDLLAPMPF